MSAYTGEADVTTNAEKIKALPTAHFVDWLERYAGSLRYRYAGSLRYGDPPTNGDEVAFLEVARRLSEMKAENEMLRGNLELITGMGIEPRSTMTANALLELVQNIARSALEHQQKGEGL